VRGCQRVAWRVGLALQTANTQLGGRDMGDL